jgi:Zn-dependent protease with chaperone function
LSLGRRVFSYARRVSAPEQLMSPLQAITSQRARGDLRGGRALSAFCIVPSGERKLELLMDHPPIEKSLARLAELARELGTPVA